jgi:hypothetical protein
MKQKLRCLALGTVLCSTVPAWAQVGPALDPGVMVGYAGGEANRHSLARHDSRSSHAGARPVPALNRLNRSALSAKNLAPRVPAVVRYTPDAAATRRNADNFVARIHAVDPTVAADLERSLRGGALVDDIRRELAAHGLDGNDVADATAAYLVTAWHAARGSDQDPDRRMLRSVSDQLARAMALDPAFKTADNAAKQELAEAMMIHTAHASAAVKEAKADPARLAAVSRAIAQGARNTFGFGMDAVTLDESGLHGLR